MEAEIFLGLLLRVLPALIVFVLAFIAMSDKKTRDRWNNLLYQIGSIRSDQREDVKIGRGVKWPFFLVAVALLLWPLQFYRHASRTIDTAASDLQQKAANSQGDLTSPAPQGDLGAPVPAPTNSAAPQSDLMAPR